MGIIANNAIYITKSIIIGAPHPNTVTILLQPMKEKDELILTQWL